MPTITQLLRNIRQPKKNVKKSPALKGCPQCRGTCTFAFQSSLRNRLTGWRQPLRFPTPSNFQLSLKTRLEKRKKWQLR